MYGLVCVSCFVYALGSPISVQQDDLTDQRVVIIRGEGFESATVAAPVKEEPNAPQSKGGSGGPASPRKAVEGDILGPAGRWYMNVYAVANHSGDDVIAVSANASGIPRMLVQAKATDVMSLEQARALYTCWLIAAPDDARAWAGRAGVRASQGDLDGALADYSHALALPMPDPLLFLLRSRAWEKWGEPVKAESDLATFRALAPVRLQGEVLLATGQIIDAIELYTDHLSKHPDDAWTFAFRSRAWEEQERWDNAVADMVEATRLAPNNIALLEMRAQLFLDVGHTESALLDLAKLTRMGEAEERARAHDTRGDVYVSLGQFPRALAEYQKAITLDPQEALYHVDKGACLASTGAVKGAIAEFDAALELEPDNRMALGGRAFQYYLINEYDKAITDLSRSLALNRRSPRFLQLRGECWIAKQDYKQALADLNQVLKLNPGDLNARALRALALARTGDLEAALTDCQLVLSQDAGHTTALLTRAESLAKRGEHVAAMRDLNRVIQLRSDLPEGFILRGSLHLQAGEYKKALQDLNRALVLDRDNIQALELRARTHAQLKDHASVIADCNRILKRVPGSVFALALRASIWVEKSEFAKSVEDYDAAIRIDPRDFRLLVGRAHALTYLEEDEAAMEDAERAVALAPHEALAFDIRGQVHLNRYENVEAILDFGRCLALEPNNVNSLSSRGFAQSRLGNDAEALADFKQVARLAPDEHLGYLGCAFVFSSSTDPGFRDAKGAVDNATKACEMTHWQNPFCLTVLACSLAESGDFEGAVRREEESFALRNDVTEADRKAHQYLLMLFRNGFTYHKRSHTSN